MNHNAGNAAEGQQWPAPDHAQDERGVNNGQHPTTDVEGSAMPALNSEAPPSEAASSEAPPLPKAPPVSPMPTWARSAPGPATTEGSAEAWPFSEAPPPEASPAEAALSEAPPPTKAPPTYHLIGAFLQPASLIGRLALASRRIKQAAFDVWVEQAIQAAYCLFGADEAKASKVTRSALVCLHGIMDSWHASMLYVAFAARATPKNDKLIIARALRDIITRCVIREVGLCKESLFKEKMRLIFGEYLEHDKDLFSQMLNAFHHNVGFRTRAIHTPARGTQTAEAARSSSLPEVPKALGCAPMH